MTVRTDGCPAAEQVQASVVAANRLLAGCPRALRIACRAEPTGRGRRPVYALHRLPVSRRRLLLLECVLLPFVIELDQDLSSPDAVTEIREDPPDLAVRFRRNRDLIDRRESPDDVNGPAYRLLMYRRDGNWPGISFGAAGLSCLRFRAAHTGRCKRNQEQELSEWFPNGHRHRNF